jgi:hypothetical protein
MEDFQPLRRQDQTITIWGEVATLGFNVSVNRDYGSLLYERFFADEDRGELEPAIVDIVRQHLGPQFEARIEIRSGSMWVIVIIQAVRAIYQSIAEYEKFKEGLSQLSSDIKNVVAMTSEIAVPADQFTINSALTPGSALLYAEAMTIFNNTVNDVVGKIRLLLWALVFSIVIPLLLAIAAGLIWLL